MMASVYHYTTSSALLSMLKKGGLASAWATPLQLLNDRDELRLGFHQLLAFAEESGYTWWVQAIERLLIGAGSLSSDAYSMSFSKEKDSLPQWLNYGDRGFGVCIEVDDRNLSDRKVKGHYCKVVYEDEAQKEKCQEFFNGKEEQDPMEASMRDIFYAACQMKNPTFQHEKEVRVLFNPSVDKIEFRAIHGRVTPYIDFVKEIDPIPVKSISLGPSWQLAKLKNRRPEAAEVGSMAAIIKEPCYLGLLRFLEKLELDIPINFSESTYSPN
jgi:hypothetical protein